MAKQVVTAFAPASVGNVGPGFDVFGLALKGLGDKVTARRVSGSGVNILSIEGDDGKLSRDPSENTAGLAAAKTLKLCRDEGDSFGVEIILHKGLPLNSGLGSSGASAAAAARAVSKLSDVVLSDQQLLEVCVEAEAGVAGYHADNVAPSLLGGFIIIESYHPISTVRLTPPMDIPIGLVKPQIDISTRKARELVPELVTINSTINNLSKAASMVAHLMNADLESFGTAIRDVIVEPARAALVPGFMKAKHNLLEAGALGCSLSGSGPTLFFVASKHEELDALSQVAIKAFEDSNIQADFIASGLETAGSIEVVDD